MHQGSQPLLSPAAVAARLSIRAATLARWRWLRIGPPYLRIGGSGVAFGTKLQTSTPG